MFDDFIAALCPEKLTFAGILISGLCCGVDTADLGFGDVMLVLDTDPNLVEVGFVIDLAFVTELTFYDSVFSAEDCCYRFMIR